VFIIDLEITTLAKIINIIVISIYLFLLVIAYLKYDKKLIIIIFNNNLYIYLFAAHRLVFYIVACIGLFSHLTNYTMWMNMWSVGINLQLFFSLIGIIINDLIYQTKIGEGNG